MVAPQIQSAEALSKDSTTRREFSFYDANGKPVHVSRIEHKNKPLIKLFPFTYSERKGVTPRRISEIELKGWSTISALPSFLRRGTTISLGHKGIMPLMRLLYSKFPKLTKLIITTETNATSFTSTTATFSIADLDKIIKAIGKEISAHEIRRKTTTLNTLSQVSKDFSSRSTRLPRDGLTNFLALYEAGTTLSPADIDTVLQLVQIIPFAGVTITENFIETKNQINVVLLDNIIDQFESLMEVKSDNEKSWQDFFAKHGWILASVFPYQVILYKREAYVGGKTIENSEGRVVDFLFQNGFRDNYALLEIKTHNKQLLKKSAYREPSAFAQHEDCSGAISQCLDQKNTFISEMGQKHKILDPKVVLIIGRKGELTEAQAPAFELLRNNQKNVDVITFDELLEKLIGLRSILRIQ